MCVCVKERDREGGREGGREIPWECMGEKSKDVSSLGPGNGVSSWQHHHSSSFVLWWSCLENILCCSWAHLEAAQIWLWLPPNQ